MLIKRKFQKSCITICALFSLLFINFSLVAEENFKETPGYFLDMGFSYYFEGNYEKALESFQKNIQLGGENEVSLRYLGKIYFETGDFSKATDYLERAVALDKKSTESLKLLGEAYIKTGKVEKLIEVYEKMAVLEPDNIEIIYTLAQVYQNINNQRKSIIYYKKLVAIIEADDSFKTLLTNSYMNLANYSYSIERYDQALFYYKKIYELDKFNMDNLYILGELYKLNGFFAESIKVNEQLLSKDPENIAALESIVESLFTLNDPRIEAYLSYFSKISKLDNELFKAMSYFYAENYEDAELYFNKAIEKHSNRLSAHIGLFRVTDSKDLSTLKKRAFTVMVLCNRIGLYALSQEYAGVVFETNNKQILEKKSGNQNVNETEDQLRLDLIEFYYSYSMTLDKLNQKRQAIAYLSNALEEFNKISQQRKFAEKKYDVLLAMGWQLLDVHESHLKIKDILQKAIELKKDDPRAYYLKGIYLHEFEKTNSFSMKEAEVSLEKAVDKYINGSGEESAPSSYYFYLGVIEELNGKYDEMVENLEKSILLDPYNHVYLNYLGYMYSLKDREIDRAYEYIKRALDEEPENEAYLDSLGWILFKKKDYDEALGNLIYAKNRSDRKGEVDAVIFFHIAETYDMLNQKSMAIKYYKAAIDNIQKASEPLDRNYLEKKLDELNKSLINK